MVVCQYFLRGQCRFGDSCRNEHPANGQQSTFGTTGNSWLRTGTGGTTAKANEVLPYDAQTMANDMRLGGEKPNWPLSCYAPAKHEPVLIPGLDESSEELRVKAYVAIKAGNLNEYLSYEANQISAADQAYANARANSAEAFDKARKQSKLIPYVENKTTSAFGMGTSSGSAFPSSSSAFASQPTTSVFGSLNTAPTTSVFGTPVFGQPAFGQTAFGQPSTTAPVSAFGQPAQTTNTSVFGQPSQPTATSVFGQPSQPTSVFGQPSQPTSVFGQSSQPTSVFGQPSQPTATSAFGQTSQPTSVFGQSSFGQPASNPLIKPASGAFSAFSGSGPSAFGAAASTPSSTTLNPTSGGGGAFSAFAGNQPSAFGLASNNTVTSVFGQPSFGQPAPNAGANANQGSVFGAPSAFGEQQQTTSAFGANPDPSVFGAAAPSTSVFGAGAAAPSAFGAGVPTSSVFGGGGGDAPSSSPFGTQQSTLTPETQPQSQLTATPSIAMSSSSGTNSSTTMNTPLDLSGLSAKFPYRPGSTPYDGLLPADYMELVPQTAKAAFLAERFEWGQGVPEWVPPLEVR